ncbi:MULTISPECIES: hypothetical protein [Bradyrhizobium]|uniref:Uncharacterized protein n=1 Tax=Bradyrhizobium arachidis TaxID=858423 RepID=A0AAE7NHQ2_9BRAD|nr:hypothetical protein [Bradyrhizobium arachidis]QOZ66388.1 hypothetical protein WN72_08205 [Bradyrhizobium arachidis]SFV18323.1 hypothetical protein SAMN05192541_13440 [Bradyrhizobium arachidis]
MSKQNDFYERVVAALHAIDRRGLKRLSKKLLNAHPGDLDLPDGAEFSNTFLTRVENTVSRAMHVKVASLRAQANALERAAFDFDGKSAVRRFEVKTAHLNSMNELVEAFADDWCDKNVIGWRKKEAA